MGKEDEEENTKTRRRGKELRGGQGGALQEETYGRNRPPKNQRWPEFAPLSTNWIREVLELLVSAK